jgi:hypothetical protein
MSQLFGDTHPATPGENTSMGSSDDNGCQMRSAWAAHKRMSGRQGVPSGLNARGHARAGPPSLGPAECGNAVSLTQLAGDDITRGPSMPWDTGMTCLGHLLHASARDLVVRAG